jgi:hypothetical protein
MSTVKIDFFISIPLIPYSYGVEFFIFLWIYTQSVGLLGRVIGPSQGLYLNTGQHKHRKTRARAHTHTHTHTHTHIHQTSIPYVGFEPTITATKRAKRVHALDLSATVTGVKIDTGFNLL